MQHIREKVEPCNFHFSDTTEEAFAFKGRGDGGYRISGSGPGLGNNIFSFTVMHFQEGINVAERCSTRVDCTWRSLLPMMSRMPYQILRAT